MQAQLIHITHRWGLETCRIVRTKTNLKAKTKLDARLATRPRTFLRVLLEVAGASEGNAFRSVRVNKGSLRLLNT